MSLEVEPGNEPGTWRDLTCTPQIRVTGACCRCKKRTYLTEHKVLTGESVIWGGWFCPDCCPVHVESFHVDITEERKAELLLALWGLSYRYESIVNPTDGQLLLMEALVS